MFVIISNTNISCWYLDPLLYLVLEKSFVSSNVSIWVILDIHSIHRFLLMAARLVLLTVKLCISTILMM